MNTQLNNELTGKRAFVTGGGRGIGAAVARRLATAGADVALTYRSDDESAASVVKEIEAAGRLAKAVKVDNADTDALVAAVNGVAEEFGGLDVLVNNAAMFPTGPLDQVELGEFDAVMAANVRAPFAASVAASAHMGDGGRIISIGSNVAVRAPFAGLGLYTLSKTALLGLTAGLARDLGPRGITVNLVNPGPTDTDLNPADGPMGDAIRAHTALGRFAQPEDIAGMVAYLAGPAAAYVTGASILVDGGFSI
ncbi:SDR family oxidoreductase [Phytoactinopolyspora alkaliphila]|uniref:SDR family oxidoreductase n=1 Tax=Phytoactinopolyspora alkaliphila TaxID=1783498 RepID=A0A6N9YJ34_9ACTN|nr:SDR family oxidoreductase [Phytoactinopolyspora alkaliphila]NED94974.1 SDR family oxidoreductase [Phytoactinopolyspora alkaliphila]